MEISNSEAYFKECSKRRIEIILWLKSLRKTQINPQEIDYWINLLENFTIDSCQILQPYKCAMPWGTDCGGCYYQNQDYFLKFKVPKTSKHAIHFHLQTQILLYEARHGRLEDKYFGDHDNMTKDRPVEGVIKASYNDDLILETADKSVMYGADENQGFIYALFIKLLNLRTELDLSIVFYFILRIMDKLEVYDDIIKWYSNVIEGLNIPDFINTAGSRHKKTKVQFKFDFYDFVDEFKCWCYHETPHVEVDKAM